jgi:hypothetical protein
MWCSDTQDTAGCNRCGDYMVEGVWQNEPTRKVKKVKKWN